VTHDESERQKASKALGGKEIVIDDERWRHVLDRHPELKEMRDAIEDAMRAPDEAFVDAQGAFHLVKRLRGGPSDFLVAVLQGASRRPIIAAYCTNRKRKEGMCRKFKKPALS
jgi:hypothetical protein